MSAHIVTAGGVWLIVTANRASPVGNGYWVETTVASTGLVKIVATHASLAGNGGGLAG